MAKQAAKAIRSTSKSRKAREQQEKGMIIGGIAIAAVAFAILIFVLINQVNTSSTVNVSPGKYSDIPQSTTAEGAPILGNPDAKVTIIEFADFSCPHCREYHPLIQTLIEEYVRPGKIRFIYQPEIFVGGQYSNVAAQAALCAGKQGRFWEMHDALFQIQETRGITAFEPETMKVTADSLGINGSEVKACIARGDMEKAVRSAYDIGEGYGVTGTPAVMISTDGKSYRWLTGSKGEQLNKGGIPYDLLVANIEQALKQ